MSTHEFKRPQKNIKETNIQSSSVGSDLKTCTEKLASYSVMVDTYQWQVDTATFKNIGTVEDEPTLHQSKNGTSSYDSN